MTKMKKMTTMARNSENTDEEKTVYDFIEYVLSQKADFAAEKLRPSYLAYARAFLEKRGKGQQYAKPAPPQ